MKRLRVTAQEKTAEYIKTVRDEIEEGWGELELVPYSYLTQLYKLTPPISGYEYVLMEAQLSPQEGTEHYTERAGIHGNASNEAGEDLEIEIVPYDPSAESETDNIIEALDHVGYTVINPPPQTRPRMRYQSPDVLESEPMRVGIVKEHAMNSIESQLVHLEKQIFSKRMQKRLAIRRKARRKVAAQNDLENLRAKDKVRIDGAPYEVFQGGPYLENITVDIPGLEAPRRFLRVMLTEFPGMEPEPGSGNFRGQYGKGVDLILDQQTDESYLVSSDHTELLQEVTSIELIAALGNQGSNQMKRMRVVVQGSGLDSLEMYDILHELLGKLSDIEDKVFFDEKDEALQLLADAFTFIHSKYEG